MRGEKCKRETRKKSEMLKMGKKGEGRGERLRERESVREREVRHRNILGFLSVVASKARLSYFNHSCK